MAKKEGLEMLNRTDLKYLLIDALKLYSEDIEYISGNNPYLFNINKKPFWIYIHNISDTGTGRPNKDEARIQVGKSKNFLAPKNSRTPVFFFGYSKEYNTFTAWNPFLFLERINSKAVVSLFTRFSVQERASKQGISVYEDNKKQVIISFRPEYLGLYLENFEQMHLSDEKVLLELINKSEDTEETEDKGISINIERKEFIVTHKRFKRDAMFKKVVYEVYEHRCAVCGIQLELIEAAHIIPHSDKKGNDDPKNGICLCALHHAAYDSGLIYFGEDYLIKVNGDKVKYLEKTKKDGGIKKFIDLQFEKINLPSSHAFYPSKDYIQVANKIRGINNG